MRAFTGGRTIAATLTIMFLTTIQTPPSAAAQREARWAGVSSVQVGANGLVVIAVRGVGEAHLIDGTYKSRSGGLRVKDGAIVSLMSGADEFGIEEVTIGGDDEIILHAYEAAGEKASPEILPDGGYELDGGAGHDMNRTPTVTAFRVRAGVIYSAVLAR